MTKAKAVLVALAELFAVLALIFFISKTSNGAPPDACEIACGETYTQCLRYLGQDVAAPNPRAEHTCRIWTERECIRPCRRGK